MMLRTLIVLPVLLVLAAAAALYAAYGEVDPCRVLAVERARRAEAETGIHIGKMVEPWMRAETSQLSTGQCAREVLKSWKARYWDSEEKAENRDQNDRDYAGEPDYRTRNNGGDYRDYQDGDGYARDGY
jgi:hypothetical protein